MISAKNGHRQRGAGQSGEPAVRRSTPPRGSFVPVCCAGRGTYRLAPGDLFNSGAANSLYRLIRKKRLISVWLVMG